MNTLSKWANDPRTLASPAIRHGLRIAMRAIAAANNPIGSTDCAVDFTRPLAVKAADPYYTGILKARAIVRGMGE